MSCHYRIIEKQNCTKGAPEAENTDDVLIHLRSLSELQLTEEIGYKYTGGKDIHTYIEAYMYPCVYIHMFQGKLEKIYIYSYSTVIKIMQL